jgi:hypothetical protein
MPAMSLYGHPNDCEVIQMIYLALLSWKRLVFCLELRSSMLNVWVTLFMQALHCTQCGLLPQHQEQDHACSFG